MKLPEKYRDPLLPDGFFKIPHPTSDGLFFRCLVLNGYDWEHLTVTVFEKGKRPERCPTWEEMCFIKSLFWEDEEAAMQLHPPKSEWVSNHPFALHLWKPKNIEIPLPPSILVGIKELDSEAANQLATSHFYRNQKAP
jgi:hypothetical protein